MTVQSPWPDPHGQRSGANPSWLGQTPVEHYRPAPGSGALTVQPTGPAMLPGATNRRTASGVTGLLVSGGVLAFAGLFLVVPYLLANTGTTGFVIGFIASLFPLGSVLLAVFVIDRWEPEPFRLLLFAFLWGAVVSVAVTLVVQPFFLLAAGLPAGADYEAYMATVQAPVVEEASKSAGLLLILLLARKNFDGPVDGVVFGFTIAGGFAFTENILYFGTAIAQSQNPGTDLAQLFVLRGIMSPFAHAIFTGATGLIMGFAAWRWNRGLGVAAFAVGLIPAMVLHSRWNSMGQGFLAQYVFVQIPIFLLAVLMVVLLRVAENRLTRRRLTEYAAAGWFTAAEVQMLATMRGRRSALHWAASLGRRREMKRFLHAATRLAFTRQRILSGRDVSGHQLEEQRQLADVVALRAAVLSR